MTPAHTRDKNTLKKLPTDQFDRVKFIHQIQKSQGDFPCFKTAYNYFCDSSRCVWRKECKAASDKYKK